MLVRAAGSSLGIVKGHQALPEQEPGGKLLEAVLLETSCLEIGRKSDTISRSSSIPQDIVSWLAACGCITDAAPDKPRQFGPSICGKPLALARHC